MATITIFPKITEKEFLESFDAVLAGSFDVSTSDDGLETILTERTPFENYAGLAKVIEQCGKISTLSSDFLEKKQNIQEDAIQAISLAVLDFSQKMKDLGHFNIVSEIFNLLSTNTEFQDAFMTGNVELVYQMLYSE